MKGYRRSIWKFRERPMEGLVLLLLAAVLAYCAGGVVGWTPLWFVLLVLSWGSFFFPVTYSVEGDRYEVRVGGIKVREGKLSEFGGWKKVEGGIYFLHVNRRSLLNVYRGLFLPCEHECDDLVKLYEEAEGGRLSSR